MLLRGGLHRYVGVGLWCCYPFARQVSQKVENLEKSLQLISKEFFLLRLTILHAKEFNCTKHLRGVTACLIRRGLCLRVLGSQTADVRGYIGIPA